jgi:mannosyl-3-phosphoglycerate phosphatase
VFSSLDAALLDSHACSSHAAAKAVELLAREGIPLVFCSSKTRAQLELIHQEIGISHPFISENGAAVFVPGGYFDFEVPNARDIAGYRAVEFGRAYADVVKALHRAAERLRINVTGFNDMSVEEVALDCHLSLLQARLAKLREYDEPFRILESDVRARNRLAKALHAANLACTSHRRYEHVGAPVGTEIGVNLLCTLYRRAFGSVFTVGLGDNLNAPLLRRVDIPLIVDGDERDVIRPLLAKVTRARLTSAAGVAGWADAIVATVDAIRQHGNVDLPAQRSGR